MGGRALLVVIVGVILIVSRIFLGITASSNEITENAEQVFLRQSAKNISKGGLNLGLRALANNPSWRGGAALLEISSGKVRVTGTDTIYAGRRAVKLESVGYAAYGTSLERRETSIAYFQKGGFIPPTLKAAVTTNNPVTTLGTLTVDGRDHGTSGALIAGQGTAGIWTTNTFSQSGGSKVGGSNSGVDYAPAKPANANTVAAGQTWPGGYPGTPDSVLGGTANGFPEGFLKAFAQSGMEGSQYATNPASLTYPLKGVTYVELPSGGIWQGMDISGSGILIVHNASRNAIMKNLNSGTFTGLMIIDDPIHIQATIIGAVIGLTPTPSEGNCIGNGSGSVLYSSRAVVDAIAMGASDLGYGSASRVLAWWE